MRLSIVSVLLLVACFSAAHGLFDKTSLLNKPKPSIVHVATVHDSGESDESEERCTDSNEVWYNCLPSCPITCKNLEKSCRSKTSRCRAGCDCKYGYARLTSRGPCERVSRCPDKEEEKEEDTCPKNEVYKCGTSCEESCNSVDGKCKNFRGRCKKGCYCKPGYVRQNGLCVRDSVCTESSEEDQTCGTDEVWKNCGRSCDEKCNPRHESCSTRCLSGCFCRKGYVRMGGDCVKKSKCSKPDNGPSTCESNASWKSCGYECTESCDDSACLVDRSKCRPGCFCDRGYKRDKGVCVRESMCEDSNEQQCGRNEKYSSCGNVCGDSCDPDCTSATVCKSGCYCEEGYKRVDGVCVKKSQCPQTCPKDQVWAECGRACQDLCTQPQGCSDEACSPRCVCAPGFKKDSLSGKCAPYTKCKCAKDMEYKLSSSCNHVCLQKDVECSSGRELGCFCKGDKVLIPGAGDVCYEKSVCEHADLD